MGKVLKEAPSFSLYAEDFLTGVMYLTNEEIGVYIKMLCKQWTDKKIPKKRLGLLVGLEWEKLSDELKSKFEDKGEYVVNTRLEKERERKENYLNKQRQNGKMGGRTKKQPIKKTQSKPKKTLNEEGRLKKEERKGKREDEIEKKVLAEKKGL